MYESWSVENALIAMTLYTDSYVIRGTISTRQRRLSDILNMAEDEFLVLSDATMDAHGALTDHHVAPFAQVNLAAVLFAVTSDTIVALPELRTPKVAEATLISIPPFSVTGQIHLLPGREIQNALQELQGRFLPVTDATFWSAVLGEAPKTAPMLAINHARAQILSPYGPPPPGD